MKKSILFVDDDANLISGLKRSMRSLLPSWELYYAFSGQEALAVLEKTPVDMIVTDMRMPGMDGSQLLEIVSKQFPHTIRFVLSGHADLEMALRSTRVAHQFIAKPCDTRQLAQMIQHSFQLRDLQSDPKLLRVINSIKRLPSLPALYLQLVQEMESPDASSKSISRIISQDITMTAKTLQLANSAFYGLANNVTNLGQAVTIIGINTLKGLVLGQQVFSQYNRTPSRWLSLDELWDHSVWVGNLSRAISRSLGLSSQAQDDAQVAGVMHDIGKLIQLEIPGFYTELEKACLQGIPELEAEYQILGTSHAELGAYLLGLWGLPDPVVQSAAYHHTPSKQTETTFVPLTAVHIANSIVTHKLRPGQKQQDLLDMNYLQLLKITNKLPSWQSQYQSMLERFKNS